MSLFFKENTLAEVIYLLNIFNKIRFFLGNSNNADRNDVNEQNTCTLHTGYDTSRSGGVIRGAEKFRSSYIFWGLTFLEILEGS